MNKINLEIISFILCHVGTLKYKMEMLTWMEAEEVPVAYFWIS